LQGGSSPPFCILLHKFKVWSRCRWRGRGGLAQLRSPLGHCAAKCSNFLSITLCFGVQVKDVSGFEAGQQLKVEDMFQVRWLAV